MFKKLINYFLMKIVKIKSVIKNYKNNVNDI